MTLDTVADYLAQARVLLQDGRSPYRYSDSQLVMGLNDAFLEARRLRPDLFIGSAGVIPSFSAGSPSTAVALDPQYRVSFLYYICGQAQLRDDEPTEDARATIFLNKFTAQLLTLPS